MLRTTLLMFALACSSTAAIGCVDDDGAADDGPQKSGEDDPDFENPADETPPVGCRVQLQGQDDPDCTPTK